jgi:hypothetical protein
MPDNNQLIIPRQQLLDLTKTVEGIIAVCRSLRDAKDDRPIEDGIRLLTELLDWLDGQNAACPAVSSDSEVAIALRELRDRLNLTLSGHFEGTIFQSLAALRRAGNRLRLAVEAVRPAPLLEAVSFPEFPWRPPPEWATGATPPAPEETEPAPNRVTRATVSQRMLEVLHSEPDSINWSQRDRASRLECSASAIAGTQAWQTVKEARAIAKVERLEQRRRR